MSNNRLPRRPGDFSQRAFIIGELSTGNMTEADVAALPPMGKEIGGHARTQALTAEQRSEIAAKGGLTRAKA